MQYVSSLNFEIIGNICIRKYSFISILLCIMQLSFMQRKIIFYTHTHKHIHIIILENSDFDFHRFFKQICKHFF